jgi:hypothetical protein
LTNKEVYDLYKYKDQTIVAEIKKSRLCWTGYLERMPNTRAAKVVYAKNPGGKRPKGIPRLRWLNVVERDMRLMGVQAWMKKTRDLSQWKELVR